MLDHSINLLEELDSASQIHTLQRDDIDALMLEFATRITATLKIERMSVWIFNERRDAIISMGEYDTRTKKLQKEKILLKKDFPNYFYALEKNKIILAPEIYEDSKTMELSESYSKPNNIVSLMDIPMRMMGQLIGVMCFEKTGDEIRHFSEKEQTFAFGLAVVFASNLEARHRRIAQTKLEAALKEKEILIHEINHRVKNNFSILVSLMRLSKNQKSQIDPKNLLDEFEQRILSMLKIHDLLFISDNHFEIPVGKYLNALVNEFQNAHPEFSSRIQSNIEDKDIRLESRTAINLGLIITEIFLNTVKHIFLKKKDFIFQVDLTVISNQHFILKVGDTGNNFNFSEQIKKETLGLSLIKDLSEEVCESVVFPNEKSSFYEMKIKL